MISNDEALAILDKLSNLFGVQSPGLALDCEEIEHDKQILAGLIIEEDVICLRQDKMEDWLVAHEFGHYLYHIYHGKNGHRELDCENWARFFEAMWKDNQFGFYCEICNSTGPVIMLIDGDLMCLQCESIYTLVFN
ncbi:MAG: hypothetical protein Q7R49_05815 [Candidatus Daviesbacteria bacterium]|nr:hypothetical protein [Candidatus Daviesbacteria bacterium]